MIAGFGKVYVGIIAVCVSFNCCGQNFYSSFLESGKIQNDKYVIYSWTEVIRHDAVVNRNGAEFWQDSAMQNGPIGYFSFGESIDVIEENENYIGVKLQVPYYFEDGIYVFETKVWEKVYVLKTAVGSDTSIQLLPNELNIISYLKTTTSEESFDLKPELKELLKVELVDKEVFEKQAQTAVAFLAEDNKMKKKDGVLELKCKTENKVYVDYTTYEDNILDFTYIGQINELNKYVVSAVYPQGKDFLLVDRTSGEQTHAFESLPLISPDKKYILSVSNQYSDDVFSVVDVYSLNDQEIEFAIRAAFSNWICIDPEKIFWGSDGYLYLEVVHSKFYQLSQYDIKNYSQYIRIAVL